MRRGETTTIPRCELDHSRPGWRAMIGRKDPAPTHGRRDLGRQGPINKGVRTRVWLHSHRLFSTDRSE